MKKLKQANLKNKRVLMRVGFDVGIDEKGEIIDDTRIKESLPTIKYILGQKPKSLVVISHLGRPEGKVVPELKLDKVVERLREFLRISNKKYQIKNEIPNIKIPNYEISDNIFLLENIRFYPEEEKNDADFAKKLASLGDIFVFEAFSAAHREHASVTGIMDYLPSYAGFEMEREVFELSKLLGEVKRPYLLIIGGAKTEDKASIIDALKEKADKILVGGRTSNLLCQENKYQDEEKIILAVDGLDKNKEVISADEDPMAILDIGPKTIKLFCQEIIKVKTILVAGPLGMVENKEFAGGTREIYSRVAGSDSYKVAAGGDTIKTLNKFGLFNKFNFISTGGGAALEFLAKGTLPVIKKLEANNDHSTQRIIN
ncbi:phosphoglycerate kinase [Patescibacteria group bacterium]|nr:phosphoglycerate kinase [Patescibacteria group bacterium]